MPSNAAWGSIIPEKKQLNCWSNQNLVGCLRKCLGGDLTRLDPSFCRSIREKLGAVKILVG
jgi:hypothetical protein